VLLIARTRAAERELKLRLEERSLASVRAAERGAPAGEADKTYLAITWGRPAREGLISLPLERDPSPLRVKVRVSRAGEGLVARTGVEVLAETTGYALVRCDLFTGRQHQIRVHLAALGAPVVGDKLYGPEEALLARGADRTLTAEDLDVLELPRHALHAYSHRLAADGQASGAEYVAPLPRELADFWRSRGGTVPPELEAGAPLPRRSF
jgi:23S rRNA pseudouridine1911/1915/1917 synthase